MKPLIKIIAILILILPKEAIGQTLHDSTLSVFYNNLIEWTIKSDKNDSTISNFLIRENRKFGNIFIVTDFNKKSLKSEIASLNIKYICNHEDELKVINEHKGKKNKRLFLWVNHKYTSNDTIDIVVTGRFLSVIKGLTIRKWHIKFKTYKLDMIFNSKISGRDRISKYWIYSIGRLIYDDNMKSWSLYTWDKLLDMKNE